jgi:homoserine dehydrogenase
MEQIGIGLAGLGTVGTGVYKHLIQNRVLISERVGLELAVRRIAVRNPNIVRAVHPPAGIVTRRWEELIEDPTVNILVELMGGIDTPYQFMMRALDAGKVVVTGNKAVLADR